MDIDLVLVAKGFYLIGVDESINKSIKSFILVLRGFVCVVIAFEYMLYSHSAQPDVFLFKKSTCNSQGLVRFSNNSELQAMYKL